MKQFAVLQLSGCAGCEVALLNAEEWLDQYKLVYMPLVVSAYDVPEVDVLLVSGSVRTDEDLYHLRQAARRGKQVIAVGTCAISGGVAHLGDRDEVRQLFLAQEGRLHLPRLLPKSRPIDSVMAVDRYLPGCPPTPELFMAALFNPPDFKVAASVCQECGRRKDREMRPEHLVGFLQGEVFTRYLPDQPGLSVHRHHHPRRLPGAVYACRAPMRGVPWAFRCLYREGIEYLVHCYQTGLHRDDRYPG